MRSTLLMQFILPNNLNLGGGVPCILLARHAGHAANGRLVLCGAGVARVGGDALSRRVPRNDDERAELRDSESARGQGDRRWLRAIPRAVPHVIWLAMASMLLGVIEAVAHTAEIKLFRLKHPYSPG